jgi:transcriptional regulator with XRE-family HTH domain
MTIGKIIKDARESASLTQTKLAKEAKIALSTLSCIESGKRNPTKEVARRIAKVLDIPEQDLTKHCNRETKAIGEGKITYIPLQYLPIAKRLTKVCAENLPQVDKLIDEILEKQRNEINDHS